MFGGVIGLELLVLGVVDSRVDGGCVEEKEWEE